MFLFKAHGIINFTANVILRTHIIVIFLMIFLIEESYRIIRIFLLRNSDILFVDRFLVISLANKVHSPHKAFLDLTILQTIFMLLVIFYLQLHNSLSKNTIVISKSTQIPIIYQNTMYISNVEIYLYLKPSDHDSMIISSKRYAIVHMG